MEVRGLFAKEKDKDGYVIIEGIRLHFVKRLLEVIICFLRLSELEQAIFNIDIIVILHEFEVESPYMT